MKTNILKSANFSSKRSFIFLFSIAFVFLLSSATIENPDNSILTGIVLDQSNNSPMEYATVSVFSKKDSSLVQGTITSVEGKFEIEKLPAGEYYCVVQFIGYKPIVIDNLTVNSKNSNLNLGKIIISPDVAMLQEAVVSADRNLVQYKIDKQVINASAAISASGGNAIDLLKTNPSITVDNEENVALRGSQDFTLLINGKPTTLSKKDALRQIPVSQIQNVEIVTNPSAKYSASGTAGIININTIKLADQSFSGIANVMKGSFGKYSGDVSLNKNLGKVNIYGSTSIGNWAWNSDVSDHKEYINPTGNVIIDDTFLIERISQNGDVKLGMEYNPNSKNSISMDLATTFQNFYKNTDTKYNIDNKIDSTKSKEFSSDEFAINGKTIDASLFARHLFDTTSHYLTFTGFFSRWNGKNNVDTKKSNSNENWQSLNNLLSRLYLEDHQLKLWDAKLDYSKTFKNNIVFETGLAGNIQNYWAIKTDKIYDFTTSNYTQNIDKAYDEVNENKLAGYFTLGKSFTGIDVQIGLRTEYHERKTNALDNSVQYNVEELNWFPTLHISKSYENKSQLQVSYSRRVEYPGNFIIAPSPFYNDGYVIQVGNPMLRAELTHSSELNHIRYIKNQMISASVYYRQTNNAIEQTVKSIGETQMLFTFENMSRKQFFGTEIGGNFKLSKTVGMNISTDTYYEKSKGELADNKVEYDQFTFNSRASINYKIKQNTKIELSSQYVSPQLKSQGKQEAMYGFNLAVRQSFMKNSLSISLSWNDILGTMVYKYSMTETNFKNSVVYKSEIPQIRLNISYKLNNFKQRENKAPQGRGGLL